MIILRLMTDFWLNIFFSKKKCHYFLISNIQKFMKIWNYRIFKCFYFKKMEFNIFNNFDFMISLGILFNGCGECLI
jgi:hypothetical protein